MIETVRVIGARGRVGSAMSARLRERGVRLVDGGTAELVLLCVPDRAIAEAAADVARGPWVAHTSGATPLAALEPHTRRFGVHPLQSFSKARGPEQLDGAWAGVSAEADDARATGLWLAETLGLRPFVLDDDRRGLYHAGAAVASNSLVTLRSLAAALLEGAGAPPEALEPLMRGVVDNGFELTGPIARGDWDTVERHVGAIREHRPDLEALYLVLAEATAVLAGRELPRPWPPRRGEGLHVARTVASVRARLAERRRAAVGLVPTMGALHEGHLSLLRAARAECDTVVMTLFVNPAQFGESTDLESYPRDEQRDLELAREAGVDIVFAPSAPEMYPAGFQTWVDVEQLGSILEGEQRPGHFRGVATVVLKLFTIVRPQRAYFGQKDAQQVAVVRQLVRDLALEVDLRVLPTVRDADGLALSSRNALLSPAERTRALALPRALATRDREAALAELGRSDGLSVDYVEVAELEPRALVGAVRIGRTRLLDNVVLEGEEP